MKVKPKSKWVASIALFVLKDVTRILEPGNVTCNSDCSVTVTVELTVELTVTVTIKVTVIIASFGVTSN